MNTSVAAGAVLPPEDPEIVQAMVLADQVSGASARVTGVQQRVGVRNAAGQVYRHTLFKTRTQVLRLAQRLARLGYANELAGCSERQGDFDAIFSRVAGQAVPGGEVKPRA
ncbi:MAG: hypothetical protein KF740_04405 [Ramlibacter sp.]|nr:hypothetical protein [Ramlibacter sp.]